MPRTRDTHPQLTDQLPWHAVLAAAVLERTGSGLLGLTDQAAAARYAHFGPNVFRVARPHPVWSVLLGQFRSVIVVLLLLAGAAALASGDLLDAGAILAVLVLNVGIGFVTELKAHRAVEARSDSRLWW